MESSRFRGRTISQFFIEFTIEWRLLWHDFGLKDTEYMIGSNMRKLKIQEIYKRSKPEKDENLKKHEHWNIQAN